MRRQASCAILLLLAIGVALPREVSAAIQISFCGQQNSCVCIDWTGPSSSWIEVRCPQSEDSVWTTCCQHDPDVFVCSRFENQPRDFAAALVIHEVLHVAGQREESDPGEEPLPPPTPAEITDAVREACDL